MLLRRQDQLKTLNQHLRGSQGELESMRERFMRLYEDAPVGFLSLGPFGQIHELNPKAAWLLGRRPQVLLQTALGLYLNGAVQFNVLFNHLEECARSQQNQMTELEVVLPKGPLRLLHAFTQVVSAKPQRFLMVLTDVTEQRRAEETNRWQASLLSLTQTGIICRDGSGQITFWNRAAHTLYGFSEAEAIGKQIFNLLRSELPESTEKIQEQLIRSGQWQGVIQQQRKSGEKILVESRWVVHQASRRGPSFVLESHQDITARKAAEQVSLRIQSELERRVDTRTADLKQANEQLEKEMSSRREMERQFLGAVDNERRRIGQSLHDNLGQQLVGSACLIRNLELELAEAKLPQVRQARRIRVIVNRAIAHMRAVSRGLTLLAVADKELPIALRNMSETVQSLFRVVCRVHCTPSVRRLSLDSQMINQLYCIAQEAVTNALKHGQPRCIWVSLALKGDWLYLRVRNDGRRWRKSSRAGIGLGIMEYRANLFGGRITLEAARGGGAELVCSVPVRGRTEGSHA